MRLDELRRALNQYQYEKHLAVDHPLRVFVENCKKRGRTIELDVTDINALRTILSDRWEQMRQGDLSELYTQREPSPVNAIFVALACLIEPEISAAFNEEIHQCVRAIIQERIAQTYEDARPIAVLQMRESGLLKQGCQILMPTVENAETSVSAETIRFTDLPNCILDENLQYLLYVPDIMYCYEKQGYLCHPYLSSRALSPCELARLFCHSQSMYSGERHNWLIKIATRELEFARHLSEETLGHLKALGHQLQLNDVSYCCQFTEYVEHMPADERAMLMRQWFRGTHQLAIFERFYELVVSGDFKGHCARELGGHLISVVEHIAAAKCILKLHQEMHLKQVSELAYPRQMQDPEEKQQAGKSCVPSVAQESAVIGAQARRDMEVHPDESDTTEAVDLPVIRTAPPTSSAGNPYFFHAVRQRPENPPEEPKQIKQRSWLSQCCSCLPCCGNT